MPYIRQEARPDIDAAIGKAIHAFKHADDGARNYILTRMLKAAFAPQSYEELNALVGLLECVKLEFYRRVAVPYEETKREQNGDVS